MEYEGLYAICTLKKKKKNILDDRLDLSQCPPLVTHKTHPFKLRIKG